jgi:hypothetical protein
MGSAFNTLKRVLESIYIGYLPEISGIALIY